MNIQFDEQRTSKIFLGIACAAACMGGLIGYYAYDVQTAAALAFPWLFITIGFYGIRLTIEDDVVYVSYGIGVPVHQIPFTEIQGFEVVPNNHITWIYDPSLENVLKLKLRDGKKVTLGIGDPRRLMAVISSRIRG